MNDQEVRDYLGRMAVGDPYGEVDGGQLLGRGRQIRRRRRWLAAGGAAVTTIAVIGAGLAVSSALGSHRPPAPPAATPTPSLGLVTQQQAEARCYEVANENPATAKDLTIMRAQRRLDPLQNEPGWRYVPAGHTKDGEFYYCKLPTHPRPSRTPPAVQPAMFAAPDASDSAVLRACSASLTRLRKGIPEDPFWNTSMKPLAGDLTGWRVVARSKLPSVGTVFVALSPRGDLSAHCEVYPPGSRWDAGLDSAGVLDEVRCAAEADPSTCWAAGASAGSRMHGLDGHGLREGAGRSHQDAGAGGRRRFGRRSGPMTAGTP